MPTETEISEVAAGVRLLTQRVKDLTARLEKPPVVVPAPPPPIVVAPPPAGPIEPLPKFNAGATVDLRGKRYRFTGNNFLPAGLTLTGGEFIAADDAALLRFGQDNKVRGSTLTGTLSSTQQFKLVKAGITNPTVTPLDRNKRYAVWIGDGFRKGSAHAQLWKCSASGVAVSQWMSVRGWGEIWMCLSGADGLQVKAPSNYDFSQIQVYELVNEYGAMPMSPYEQITNVSSYTSGVELTDCVFQRMKFAAFKMVFAKNNRVINPTLRFCLGGITTQDGVANAVEGGDLDLRMHDDRGLLVPSGIAVRNHGISIGSAEVSFKGVGTKIRGASWAVEHAEMAVVGQKTAITDMEIEAVHCGISNCATGGETHRNKIRLPALGFAGIELPTANESKTTGNDVYQERSAWDSYGIAGSHGNVNALIESNKIRADTGVQFTPPGAGMKIQRNDIQFFSQAFGPNLTQFAALNTARKV